jgi:bacterioferritin-associated ferredoxin
MRNEAQSLGIRDVDRLRDWIDFGSGCGMCLPYVAKMLVSDLTVFLETLDDGSGSDSK